MFVRVNTLRVLACPHIMSWTSCAARCFCAQETLRGQYPVESVQTLVSIARQAEKVRGASWHSVWGAPNPSASTALSVPRLSAQRNTALYMRTLKEQGRFLKYHMHRPCISCAGTGHNTGSVPPHALHPQRACQRLRGCLPPWGCVSLSVQHKQLHSCHHAIRNVMCKTQAMCVWLLL